MPKLYSIARLASSVPGQWGQSTELDPGRGPYGVSGSAGEALLEDLGLDEEVQQLAVDLALELAIEDAERAVAWHGRLVGPVLRCICALKRKD